MLAISFIEEIESIEAIAFHEHLNIRSNTLLFFLHWNESNNKITFTTVLCVTVILFYVFYLFEYSFISELDS